MAKCPICNSRKGKRKCAAEDAMICSLCCGETRAVESCDGCSFYTGEDARRNYKKVPFYALGRMANSSVLESQAEVVEVAINRFDRKQDFGLTDNIITGILEQLMNHYYFNDTEIMFSGKLEENGVKMIGKAIDKNLASLSSDEVSKILGTVYRSVKRHDAGRRAYLDFINNFF